MKKTKYNQNYLNMFTNVNGVSEATQKGTKGLATKGLATKALRHEGFTVKHAADRCFFWPRSLGAHSTVQQDL